MNLKILFLITSAILVLANNNLLEEYKKLEVKNTSSIKQNDLPDEFSKEAFITIDEFIRKTKDLEYEWVMYFDYDTGKILKLATGEIDGVKIHFEKEEFEGCSVASIHNHPSGVYSPPSGKNFGILIRDFEDYELISGRDELWILKSKCVNEKLMVELNVASIELFKSALYQANCMYKDENRINLMCDLLYGAFLSKI